MAGPLEPIDSLAALQRFLEGKDDFEALVALSEGDPLGLNDAIHGWLRERRLLLDAERVKAKTLTWLVAWSRHPIGPSSLRDLVREGLDAVGAELLDQDARDARREPHPPEPLTPRLSLLARRLGIRPDEVRYAAVAMNDMPGAEREVLHCVLVQGQGFTRFALENGMTAIEARDMALRALQSLRERISDLRSRGEDSNE